MKRSLLIVCLLACSNLNAQVALPYNTGFDTPQEQSGWSQHRKGFINQFQEWEFDNAQAVSPSKSLVHYYPVGGADVLDDWFVSPAFDISGGGSLDSLRYYFGGFGMPMDQVDSVMIYLLNGSADPDLASSKLILFHFNAANYQNDHTWRLLNPIILPAQSGNSYIAFRYRTINNWLDVRFDNIGISGTSTATVNTNGFSEVQLFPNPANRTFVFQSEETGSHTLWLYDAAGRMVLKTIMNEGEVDCSRLEEGYYNYVIRSDQSQEQICGKLVIER